MRRPPAVARVLERVTRTAREHEMFAPATPCSSRVSGGPDSTCLLYALAHLRRLLEIELDGLPLRPPPATGLAEATREYVRRLADASGAAVPSRIAEDRPVEGRVRRGVGADGSLARGRARRARRSGRAARRGPHARRSGRDGPHGAALAGPISTALVGIRPVLGAQVQPLLDVTRAEVEAFCRSLRLRPRRDPTNRDTRRLRNALRLRVIPAIERATGREIRRSDREVGRPPASRIERSWLAHACPLEDARS